MPSASPRHLDYVDGLRAIAVVGVLTAHAGWPSFGWWFPSGTRGVELFFVISGFCLAYPFLRESRAAGNVRIDYARFILRRFVRIGPPFYVALICFGILGLTSFGYPTVGPDRVSDSSVVAREFIGDLFFLIPRVPVHNVVFWTLAIEARWYVVCPLLVTLYLRSKAGFGALGVACYAMYFTIVPNVVDIGTLPCFMLGIVAADLAISKHAFSRYAWIFLSLALVVAIVDQTRLPIDRGDPIWHITAFLFVVAAGRPLPSKWLALPPLVPIGVASYSIYLVHAPVIVWLRSVGLARPFAAIIGFFIGFAFWAIAERHFTTAEVRKSLENSLASLLRFRNPARS